MKQELESRDIKSFVYRNTGHEQPEKEIVATFRRCGRFETSEALLLVMQKKGGTHEGAVL